MNNNIRRAFCVPDPGQIPPNSENWPPLSQISRGHLIALNMSSPILVSTLVSRALSSGIIGGGGPAGFGGGAGVDLGAATGRNCWLILLLLSLSWFRKRRNQPLERFDFLSSVMVLAVRLGGLEVMMF